MTDPSPSPGAKTGSHTRIHSIMVASGILLSRIAGFVRARVFAHYFGNGWVADALNGAFRIPNILQNLFGEGALSASFIPVYANLLARDEKEEADRVAGAVAAILMVMTSVLVLIGVVATPFIIDVVVPGFSGRTRELCIVLVRILFPGVGLLVWSAWCLGILNSHGRFFLSYVAPVVWNMVIIAAIIAGTAFSDQSALARWAAWGSVAGSALQIVFQLPMVFRLLGRLRLNLDYHLANVRVVVKNFVPVFFSRGVMQISSFVDQILSSFLPTGAVAAFSYAQILYTLPVSLFGMSVSAAELPAMSKAVGNEEERAEYLRKRLNGGLRQIAFFIVPSAVAFLALGDIIAAAIFQTGKFGHDDSVYVWSILAGSSVGLLASTMSRLYASTFYAMRDTRTPLRYAILRVALTSVLGYLAALQLPGLIGIDARWGVAGLTASAGFAGWIEFVLLRFSLNRRIGRSGLAASYNGKLWLAAGAGALAAWAVKLNTSQFHPILQAILVLGPYGIVYFALTILMRLPEAQFIKRVASIIKK